MTKPSLALEALKKSPLFEELDTKTVEFILERCEIVRISSWTTVISEWSPADGKAYVLLSGSAEVSIDGEFVAALPEGSLFWEYALVSEEARTASVIAKGDIECLVLDEESYLAISESSSLFSKIMMDRLEENLDKGRKGFAKAQE